MIKIWKKIDSIGGHNNLILELLPLNFTKVADSYYFALDNGFMKGDESTLKVILNIELLLQNWMKKIEKIDVKETAYLPFDFSDQYIGCLRVKRISETMLSIDYGATLKYDAFLLSPSDFAEFEINDEDFSKDNINSFEISITDFNKDIRASISKLHQKGKDIEWLN